MSTVSASVRTLRTGLGTLRTYVTGIDSEYMTYVNSHNVHTCGPQGVHYIDGFRPGSGHSWHEYRDKVSAVVTWAEKYVDDSAWVDALDTRATTWQTATGHASDAYDDVDTKNLPAVESWRGPAGRAYREVVPKMQAGTSSAYFGAMHMKGASESISTAGETFFSQVAEAVSTLASSLTHYTPAPPPRQEGDPPSVSAQGSYSCGLLHDTDDAGNHPWTAMTSCETALTTLESEVEEALRVPGAGGPAAGFVPVPDYFADAWPPAPGRH
ncbi:hypothetical protein ACOCJ5_13905 [Knoellia sp. CPCC 206450]|uniref:hypothetical protein n=1 Tax=Knoellia tibetensis TaxID=3404798 RepID=UPI003B43D080